MEIEWVLTDVYTVDFLILLRLGGSIQEINERDIERRRRRRKRVNDAGRRRRLKATSRLKKTKGDLGGKATLCLLILYLLGIIHSIFLDILQRTRTRTPPTPILHQFSLLHRGLSHQHRPLPHDPLATRLPKESCGASQARLLGGSTALVVIPIQRSVSEQGPLIYSVIRGGIQ
ncbi:hypothetical protein MRB53_028170 [Persea americana]|uniref:Uncharacterized protein n=1 Tax=Persea americana TaxID=3435 RepID=A0ACC2KF51_PERAE|nr:hypothetical protein MRB53_028170 [Persea americana]